MTDNKTPSKDQESNKGNANKGASDTNKQSDQGHANQGGHGNQGGQGGQGKQMEDTGSRIPGAKPPGKK